MSLNQFLKGDEGLKSLEKEFQKRFNEIFAGLLEEHVINESAYITINKKRFSNRSYPMGCTEFEHLETLFNKFINTLKNDLKDGTTLSVRQPIGLSYDDGIYSFDTRLAWINFRESRKEQVVS